MHKAIGIILLICTGTALAEPKYENEKTRNYIRQIKADTVSGKLIAVTSTALAKDYRSNEVTADFKYKDKFLFVAGTIDNISKDVVGNIVVGLRTDNQFMPTTARFAKDVSLIDGLEGTGSKLVTAKTVSVVEAVSSIKRGSKVHLVCRGAGYVITSAQLTACDILSK